MLRFVSTVVATEVRGLTAVCRAYWVLGAAVMSWGSGPFELWVTVLSVKFFFIRGRSWQLQREGCPSSCLAATLFKETGSSESLAPCPHPVAEIGGLCEPLPGGSDFCRHYWRAWLFLKGYAWTWYRVTAWHPMLFPSWSVEEVKDLRHRQRSASACGAGCRVCRRCRLLVSCQAQLTTGSKGIHPCSAGAFLSFGWDSPI